MAIFGLLKSRKATCEMANFRHWCRIDVVSISPFRTGHSNLKHTYFVVFLKTFQDAQSYLAPPLMSCAVQRVMLDVVVCCAPCGCPKCCVVLPAGISQIKYNFDCLRCPPMPPAEGGPGETLLHSQQPSPLPALNVSRAVAACFPCQAMPTSSSPCRGTGCRWVQ